MPDDTAGQMRMAALGLRCRSLSVLTALLAGNAVASQTAAGSVTVDPDSACGLYLRFREA